MQKRIVYSFGLIIVLVLPQCILQEKASLKDMMNELYKDISGFGISDTDTKTIEAQGCAATYGEITFEGVEKLISLLNLKDSDVFYDLGCGVGKMVIHVYLGTPVKKSVGIELSSERATKAMTIQEKLKQDKSLIEEGRTLAFYKESFLDSNLNDATVIYLASTCFSPDVMKQVTDTLAKLKKGLRVITLKKLAANDHFKLIDEFILPMTWSDNTTAYLYELQ
jgi:hypothetical protein